MKTCKVQMTFTIDRVVADRFKVACAMSPHMTIDSIAQEALEQFAIDSAKVFLNDMGFKVVPA